MNTEESYRLGIDIAWHKYDAEEMDFVLTLGLDLAQVRSGYQAGIRRTGWREDEDGKKTLTHVSEREHPEAKLVIYNDEELKMLRDRKMID